MIRFFPACLCLAGALSFVSASDTRAEFTGEVLLSPKPANWVEGPAKKTKLGLRREWTRNFAGAGATERIFIIKSEELKKPAVAAIALGKALGSNCTNKKVSKPKVRPVEIGSVASLNVQCDLKDAKKSYFANVHVLAGEYATYTVARSWTGIKDDPTSPLNSPKTGEQWASFFSRVSVCNTLTSDCDPAKVEVIHAHPRFTTMRAAPVKDKPVMAQADVLKAAAGVGTLTGQAQACGEDIGPFTASLPRMFENVTPDKEKSEQAQLAFATAQKRGHAQQFKKDKESCGEILRQFRQHPSRVSTFPRYLAQFL